VCVENLTKAKILKRIEDKRMWKKKQRAHTHVAKMQAAAQNGCDETENGNKQNEKSICCGEGGF